MKLSHLLSPSLISIGIVNTSKEQIIRQLIQILEKNGLVNNPDQAFNDLMARELQQSTGLENGIAIPHGKSPSVTQLVGALAISKDGIDFASLDGNPSHLFFMLIAPPTMSGPHVQMLANIATLSHSAAFRRRITQAESPESAYAIIKEAELTSE